MNPKQENTAVRTGISISRELLNRTDEAMKKTGARSRSDFIAEALEFYIKEDNARITNIPLMNMRLKKNILICAIFRHGRVIIPGGQDILQAGDSVIVVMTLIRLAICQTISIRFCTCKCSVITRTNNTLN